MNHSKITQRFVPPATLAAVLGLGLALTSQSGHAQESLDSRAQIGLKIAPVQLNLENRDLRQVGLGSYIVNAQSDCNGCHSKGATTEYAGGGNPYFSQHPAKINPATYLGGGDDFGAFPAEGFVHIISRNITPDKDGLPAGLTIDKFILALRTGVDADKWHPTCAGPPNGHCVPAPFDGSLFQIMPWPIYQNMPDHDLRAIYEYLRAVPCMEGDPGNPDGEDTKGTRCQ